MCICCWSFSNIFMPIVAKDWSWCLKQGSESWAHELSGEETSKNYQRQQEEHKDNHHHWWEQICWGSALR